MPRWPPSPAPPRLRFAPAGLSMGGIAAMQVVRQAPGRVDRLCLTDTNPGAEPEQVRTARAPLVARAPAGGLDAVMREATTPHCRADAARGQDIRALCMTMALAPGPAVIARPSRALAARPGQQGTLPARTGPTLILSGAEDRLCPLARHKAMHALMPQSDDAVAPGGDRRRGAPAHPRTTGGDTRRDAALACPEGR